MTFSELYIYFDVVQNDQIFIYFFHSVANEKNHFLEVKYAYLLLILGFLNITTCFCVCVTHRHGHGDSLPVGLGCRQRRVILQKWTPEITNQQ